jgi:DNA-binding PadR family transcriptional regulator
MSRPEPEPELTTTSYALLGLLALKPWTTYELAQQMDRGLSSFWPRARSNLYAEPKRLVALGLAKATTQHVGRRPRTVYTITAAGRRSLATWLKTPGRAPSLEWEQLVQVFFADAGTKTDLLATLREVAAWSEQQNRFHRQRARAYLDGEGPFPERRAIQALTGAFLADFAAMVGTWATQAITDVAAWPDEVGGAPADLEVFRRIAAHGSVSQH